MNINFLANILSIPNPSGSEDYLAKCIENWCKTVGIKCTKDGKGNLYIVKGSPKAGEFYVGATAHLDSVHRDQKELAEKHQRMHPKIDGDKITMWLDEKTQTGTGSDDKNAIAIILSLVKKVPAIKVAFYVGEETGMQGVKASDMSFWDDVAWIFGCDSPGPKNRATKSCSGTQIYSDEFFTSYLEPICKKYGVNDFRSEPWTDILHLVRQGPKICCCNINNGGYKAHTSEEWASFEETNNTEALGYELMTSIPLNVRYVFEPKEEIRTFDWGKYRSSKDSSQMEFDFDFDDDIPLDPEDYDDTDICSFEFLFDTPEKGKEFIQQLKIKGIDVETEKIGDRLYGVFGELQYVKLAYVLYFDMSYDEQYTNWADFEENEFTEDFFDNVVFETYENNTPTPDEDFWEFIKKRKEENRN